MAGSIIDRHEHEEWIPPTGQELANRVFAVAIVGVCGVIVLMVALGGWWSS